MSREIQAGTDFAGTRSEGFANSVLLLDAWSKEGVKSFPGVEREATSALVNKGVLPEAHDLLQTLIGAQSSKISTEHQSHPVKEHQGLHDRPLHQSEQANPINQHEHMHHKKHEVHKHHFEQHEDGEHSKHHQHPHHESHKEHLAKVRAEISEKIEGINKAGYKLEDKITLIALELMKDPERWKSPATGSGKCNVFVEAVLKAAGAPLPWKDGELPTAGGMIHAFLKHSESWQSAYHFNGESNAQFHEKYIPHNGDVMVWNRNGVEHVAIVQCSYDKLGNLIYAGAREKFNPNGVAHVRMDWMTGSENYGPPSYVFRSK
jgi:hypothetical protein